jgi:hypothetical protein
MLHIIWLKDSLNHMREGLKFTYGRYGVIK